MPRQHAASFRVGPHVRRHRNFAGDEGSPLHRLARSLASDPQARAARPPPSPGSRSERGATMEDEFRVFHELRPIFHEDPALPALAPLEPCSPESASFFSVPPAAPVPSSATPVPNAAFLTSTVPPPPSLSYPAEWGSQETKPAIWHAQQPAQGTQPHVRFVTAPHPYARPNPADASQRVKRYGLARAATCMALTGITAR